MEPWERERKRIEDERESRKRRSLKHQKKREKKKRERQLHVYRPKRARRRREMTGPAACPSCGDGDRLYTIETAVGYSRGPARFENGIIHFDHEGNVEIDWSLGTTTAGVACDCGWRGALADLVLAS